ncbi:Hypothetical predicted protein [Podarcis lilfordi]|uniref:Uncharacterized protein n=1 Tax=Podarcis lilfordi TaxID=74358 RepID=A0AA35P8I3_9SAUR|nr:Hypothetical predicted protein [Podarcis lilfordi]
MYISHVVACGLFLALLALALEAKPAPQNLQKGPSGSLAALGRELAELLEASSGPAAGGARSGGGKQGSSSQQKGKGSSSSRLMRDLRTDTKHWTASAPLAAWAAEPSRAACGRHLAAVFELTRVILHSITPSHGHFLAISSPSCRVNVDGTRKRLGWAYPIDPDTLVY